MYTYIYIFLITPRVRVHPERCQIRDSSSCAGPARTQTSLSELAYNAFAPSANAEMCGYVCVCECCVVNLPNSDICSYDMPSGMSCPCCVYPLRIVYSCLIPSCDPRPPRRLDTGQDKGPRNLKPGVVIFPFRLGANFRSPVLSLP